MKSGITEPLESLKTRTNIMVAPSVVNTCAKFVPLCLLNPSDDQVIIHKGTTATTLSAVNAIGLEFITAPEPRVAEAEIVRSAKESTEYRAIYKTCTNDHHCL